MSKSHFFALVGEDFSTHQAFVHLMNGTSLSTANVNSGLQFTNIINFKDIWTDPSGALYMIGENKNLTAPLKNYQVVHKLTKTLGTSPSLSWNWSRYISDPIDTRYANGNISVTPTHSRIFYTHERAATPSTYGNSDVVLGAYGLDLDFSSTCSNEILSPVIAKRIAPTPITIVVQGAEGPLPSTPSVISSFTMNSSSFCAVTPTTCDFTWTTSNCFNAVFTATAVPTGTYTYTWDMDCGGPTAPITTNSATFPYTFPCGGGTFPVCLTIKNSSGATVCTVQKSVTIANTCCASVTLATLQCTDVINRYAFTINMTDPLCSSNCTFVLTNNDPNTPLSNITYSPTTNPCGTSITGFVTWTGTGPIPLVFNGFSVQMTCICPNSPQSYTCTTKPLISIPTICCKKIEINDKITCESATTFDVPINVAAWGPLNNIGSVTWYVLPKPVSGNCPTTYWGGVPYQQTTGNVLEPLHLYPSNLTTDVCVYAVVTLNDGPCTQLFSNIGMVNRCKPTTCTLLNYEYCYSGTPITPTPITPTVVSPANVCIQPRFAWYDAAGNLLQQTGGLTPFQPPVLSMLDPTKCYEDFIFTLKIIDICGTRSYPTRIRLFSSTAKIGTLAIDPLESLPVCWEEDLTLKFTPNCANNPPLPPMWTWLSRDCNSPISAYATIVGSGTMNPVLNTNKLTKSTWFAVKAQNGVCPAKIEELKVEVMNKTILTNFKANSDACVDQQVVLSAVFSACTIQGCGTACNCSHTTQWFKDGNLIGTTSSASGVTTATFIYTTRPLTGNYYGIIKDDCCPKNVVQTPAIAIAPACEPIVKGPCFICDNTPSVILTGAMIVPPTDPCPTASSCTYKWTVLNQQPLGNISGSTTGTTATVTSAGHYLFTSTCTDAITGLSCVKSYQFDLLGCQRNPCRITTVVATLPEKINPVHVYPNPSGGDITVSWAIEMPKDAQVFITNPEGQLLLSKPIPYGAKNLSMSLDVLPAGLYFVKIRSAERSFTVAKVVKE